MVTCNPKTLGVCLLCALLTTHSPLWASEGGSNRLDPIVVSATTYDTARSETGQPVLVLKGNDLRQLGAESLRDVFQLLPNINLSNSAESYTLSVSGLPSNATKFLVDGVSLYDPSTPQGTPFLDALTVDQIDRIEILSGSQGPVHGSGAIGGTIHVITKQGATNKGNVQIETSQGNLFNSSVSYGTSILGTDITIGASQRDKAIQSALKGGSELDRSTLENIVLKANRDFKHVSVDWAYRKNRSQIDLDNLSSQIDDPNSVNEAHQDMTALTFRFTPNETIDSRLSYRLHVLNRSSLNTTDNIDAINQLDASHVGRTEAIGWQTRFILNNQIDATVGIENRTETITFSSVGASPFGSFSSSFPRTTRSFLTHSFGLNWINPILSFRAGTAFEQFSSQRAHTYGLSAFRHLNAIDTLIMANIRTGYRTPTLFERFDDNSGNPNLTAETSITKELTVEKHLQHALTSVRFFETRLTNKISYTDNGTPANFLDDGYNNLEADAISRGAEYRVSLKPVGIVNQAHLGYTHTFARETLAGATTRTRPLRVPTYKLTAALGLKLNNYSLGISGYYVDKQRDFGNVDLKPYHVVNLRGAYQLSEQTEMFVKVNNLFDREYSTLNHVQGERRYVIWGVNITI